MKYLVFFFLLGIISCSVMNKEKYVTLSTFEEQKFLLTNEDSLLIDRENLKLKKFSDSCEKYKLNCFFCATDIYPQYEGGIPKFRKDIYQNLIIPRNSKPFIYKIKMVIGKNDSIKKVEIFNYKDEKVKKEILRVLSLPEIKKWKSAQSYIGIKVDYEMIFYLNVKQKKIN